MTLTDALLLLVLLGGAFYAGYQLGRASVLRNNQSAETEPRDDDGSLPLPSPSTAQRAPERRASAPPPASAGGHTADVGGGSSSAGTPPRRSSKPPPAAAGLADLSGSGEDRRPGSKKKQS